MRATLHEIDYWTGIITETTVHADPTPFTQAEPQHVCRFIGGGVVGGWFDAWCACGQPHPWNNKKGNPFSTGGGSGSAGN